MNRIINNRSLTLKRYHAYLHLQVIHITSGTTKHFFKQNIQTFFSNWNHCIVIIKAPLDSSLFQQLFVRSIVLDKSNNRHRETNSSSFFIHKLHNINLNTVTFTEKHNKKYKFDNSTGRMKTTNLNLILKEKKKKRKNSFIRSFSTYVSAKRLLMSFLQECLRGQCKFIMPHYLLHLPIIE